MNTKKLYKWYEKQQQLQVLKQEEIELRRELFEEFFPEPKEGTQRILVPGDAELVAKLPYNYTLDPELLDAGLKHVPKTQHEALINWKPSLAKSVYNKLSKKARTGFTAECLVITPGTPSLEIVLKPADE